MKKRVCLLVTLVAIVIMGFAMNVEAAAIIDRGYCGGEGDGKNLTWTLDQDGVLIIEGQGEMKDWTLEESNQHTYGSRPTDWHNYNKSIYSVIIREGVTSIGKYAFYECEYLGKIILPGTLTNIGDMSFEHCDNLVNIDLPESLIDIGDSAFRHCGKLNSIVLPRRLTNIGDSVFLDCCKLNNIDLPETLISIGVDAFRTCESLTDIVLPKSLVSIGDEAFRNCVRLKNVNFPDSLISIGDFAFAGCYGLNNVVLPESLTSIGHHAFYYSYNLGSIYIPRSVSTIYQSTFALTRLKDVFFGGTKEQWNNINIVMDSDNNDFRNATFHYVDDTIDDKLKNFVSRLYQYFLNRDPDEEGLADWVDALTSGKATGAKAVAGFVLSPEYQANTLSNEEYVAAFYKVIFDREPDDAGIDAWVAVMERGCTNKKVLEGFVNSDEFNNLCRGLGIARGSYKSDGIADRNVKKAEFVARLYGICLGRAYEREGLDNWVSALASYTMRGSSVVQSFFDSQEFKNRELDDTSFVTVAYRTILNREPDETGLKNWIKALAKGSTRNDVLHGFLESKEFENLCSEYNIVR